MNSPRVFYGSVFAASFFLGNLAEKVSPGYGYDLMYPIQVYAGAKFFGKDLNSLECMVLGFTACGIGETFQNVGVLPGFFTVKDFIPYTLGSGLIPLIENLKNKITTVNNNSRSSILKGK
jgi:hypothetical protein